MSEQLQTSTIRVDETGKTLHAPTGYFYYEGQLVDQTAPPRVSPESPLRIRWNEAVQARFADLAILAQQAEAAREAQMAAAQLLERDNLEPVEEAVGFEEAA